MKNRKSVPVRIERVPTDIEAALSPEVLLERRIRALRAYQPVPRRVRLKYALVAARMAVWAQAVQGFAALTLGAQHVHERTHIGLLKMISLHVALKSVHLSHFALKAQSRNLGLLIGEPRFREFFPEFFDEFDKLRVELVARTDDVRQQLDALRDRG